MIIVCNNCSTRFLINPTLIGEHGRMVRCAKCGNTWRQVVSNKYESDMLDPNISNIDTKNHNLPDKVRKFSHIFNNALVSCVLSVMILSFVFLLLNNMLPSSISRVFGMYDNKDIVINGLEFKAVGSKFFIRGSVKNFSNEEKLLPLVRLTILDKNDKEIANIIFTLDENYMIKSNEVYKFFKKFEPMPHNAKILIVDIGSKMALKMR